MHVTLPDGSQKELDDGASGADLAAAIGPGLARAALAVKVGGHLRDLARPLADGDEVEIVTDRSPESLELIRHDAAHVLAAAVLDLYPGTKISIGPPIEDGFYYDFEFPEGVTVSDHDLPALEDRMREHVKAREPFTREDVTVEQALDRFHAEHQPYKVELIEDLVRDEGVDTVSLYTNGPFTDLCRGPHAPDTGRIHPKAFKLLSLAGAYWRGDASRQMLTRIYGTAFHSAKDLDAHLERLEQARARDHRKLGRELNLFLFSELSPGSPFWQPDGMIVLNALTDLWRRENAARGYREVKTPILYDTELFQHLRPLGRLPRQHVLHRGGGPRHGPEADELPGAHPDLQGRAPLLPRPADPLLRGRPGPPPRAERDAPRPLARPPHHPGRRPHLLHRGPDRRRGQPLPGLRLRDLRHVRVRAAAGALDAAGEADRHRGDVGPRGGRARGRARPARAWSSSSTPATAPSTARRSTCT